VLKPKASHLIERVAERLRLSGALDNSAAQLLRPLSDETVANASRHDLAAIPNRAYPGFNLGPSHAVTVQKQNSLLPESLALPPSTALPVLDEGVCSSVFGSLAADDITPAGADSFVTSPPAPSTIPEQPLRLRLSAKLDGSVDRPASEPLPGQLDGPAGSAVGMQRGPASIDAVSLERAGMIDWSRTRTRISEEFRLVQRQIIRSAFGPGAEPGFSNLLLVTSARPGEGKSFMSTNLAGSIARQGDHHVLLVDADSKRDSICYSFGLAQARGLLDLAANSSLDPAALIVKTPIERLSILPVGRERERSAELFSTKEMTRLIQNLGRRYADRLLILDAPPCLSTSDPAVLAQVVGQILFVVEANRTQREEIEASLDLIQACPTISMVLNKQLVSSRYTFGAYSSYYSS
jgi:protein-tyrosine kinase